MTTTGGKDVLIAEKAKTYGFGAVLTAPRSIADFTMAIDYWNVEVNGPSRYAGQHSHRLLLRHRRTSRTLLSALPRAALNNPTLVSRTVESHHLANPYLNIAQQRASGIDFDARFDARFLGGQVHRRRLQATRNLISRRASSRAATSNEYNGTLGYPGNGCRSEVGRLARHSASTTANDITLRWGVDYVGRAELERNDFYLTTGGSPAPDCDQYVACFLAEYDQQAEPYFEHGASAQFLWRNMGQVTVGLRNVFDQDPPTIAPSGIEHADPSRQLLRRRPYDYRGRSFFVNVTRSFK